jgi:hypothetical protein
LFFEGTNVLHAIKIKKHTISFEISQQQKMLMVNIIMDIDAIFSSFMQNNQNFSILMLKGLERSSVRNRAYHKTDTRRTLIKIVETF